MITILKIHVAVEFFHQKRILLFKKKKIIARHTSEFNLKKKTKRKKKAKQNKNELQIEQKFNFKFQHEKKTIQKTNRSKNPPPGRFN